MSHRTLRFHGLEDEMVLVTGEMDKIRKSLDERLVAKGLGKNEIDLFIKDVVRVVDASPELNLETIKGRLKLLGWRDDYVDYWTIQLIRACYQDG